MKLSYIIAWILAIVLLIMGFPIGILIIGIINAILVSIMILGGIILKNK